MHIWCKMPAGTIGNAVDYLTPREVRNVLVRQFTDVGQAAALERFPCAAL
jgi:hypothetical protein